MAEAAVPSVEVVTVTELARRQIADLVPAPAAEPELLEIERGGRRPAGPRFGALVHAALAAVPLDADRDGGSVLTESFDLEAPRLFVNVDARGGECRVEALDAEGNRAARSAPIREDLPSCEVEWEQGGVAQLRDKQVSLRFTMHDARLYSYWLQADSGQE